MCSSDLGEHGRDLPLGGAVDARVGPTFFPVIQVALGFRQAFKAHAFERRLLGMADAGLDLPFGSSRQLHPMETVRGSISGGPILFTHCSIESSNM